MRRPYQIGGTLATLVQGMAETGSYGAYGLRLEGVARADLAVAGEDWPLLRVDRRLGRGRHRAHALDELAATVLFANGGDLVLERTPLRAVFTTPSPIGDAELVHPYLSPAACVVSRWLGREAFHAGAFVHAGAGWIVVGDREGGKSSLLAFAAGHGHPVISDDVVVTDGSEALAGPRVVDLRQPAAEHLGVGEPIGLAGQRERWRVRLDQVAPRVPLAGWVFLVWGDSVEIARLPLPDKMGRIACARFVLRQPHPDVLLRLAGLPAFELARPRDWQCLPEALGLLTETLDATRP